MAGWTTTVTMLAAVAVGAVSCADSVEPAAVPQDSATTTTTTVRSPATTAEPTTTTSTTAPDANEPIFDVPAPAPDVRACSPTDDVWVSATFVDRGPDVVADAVFVANISNSVCGLSEPGFTVDDEIVPVGPALDNRPGSAVLAPGESAMFVVASPRPARSVTFDVERIGSVHFGLDGEYRTDSPVSKYREGVSFVGPVEWTGQPNAPIVFVPTDPSAGVPIGLDDLVTTAGVGSFRAGMAPQEVADATGRAFVISEWGVASEGCGYGWLPPDLTFTISSPSESLDDAQVGAIDSAGDRRTPSGIGPGTSVAELRAALGDDRLSTRLNEYSGAADYLFTPRNHDEQHLGMFFRIDAETLTISSYEAGLQTQIGRGEGCA